MMNRNAVQNIGQPKKRWACRRARSPKRRIRFLQHAIQEKKPENFSAVSQFAKLIVYVSTRVALRMWQFPGVLFY
jgi:hypothetical protein